GTEADLRRMACGLAARGHELHVFAADGAASLPGVTLRRVPIVRAGRLARLLSFALAAPRAVARERWDLVVGFGRTPRQDVVRGGGGAPRPPPRPVPSRHPVARDTRVRTRRSSSRAGGVAPGP